MDTHCRCEFSPQSLPRFGVNSLPHLITALEVTINED